MNLRSKTILIIFITTISLVVGVYIISTFIVLGSFTELEEKSTKRNVYRALSAFEQNLLNFNHFIFDWASWDDTYDFIKNRNENYIRSNLADETFTGSRINLIIYVNTAGEIVYSKCFDFKNEVEIPIPPKFYNHVKLQSPLLHHPTPKSNIQGIILLPENPMLVVARPIITSEEKGPIRGTLIMGRYLDSKQISNLMETTHLPLSLTRVDDPFLPKDIKEITSQLSRKNSVICRPLKSGKIAGYTVINDIYGAPALVMKIVMPREIYQRGKTTIFYFVLSLIVIGCAFGLVTLILIERQIVMRMADLSKTISMIAQGGSLTSRVYATGNDEVTRLAVTINAMLETLERSENAFKESEELYAALVNGIEDCFFITDDKGFIIFANKPLMKLLGVEHQTELTTKTLFEFVSEDEGGNIKRKFIKSIRTKEFPEFIEIPLMTKEKGIVHFELKPTPVMGNGIVKEVRGVMRDVTERRQLEEERLKADRLESLGVFAGGIAHDFNNILSIIRGNLYIVMHCVSTELREIITKAEQACAQGEQLTKQLLTFSRGGEPLKKITSLPALLKDSAQFITSGLHAKCLFSLPDDLWKVNVDQGQITQVTNNLLINAEQAMPDGGTITISASNEILLPDNEGNLPMGNYVKITISDTGVGIPPKNILKIFDPYFTTKEHGTGLGLAIVYSTIKKHRGTITVASDSGTGTTFTIYLPAIL